MTAQSRSPAKLYRPESFLLLVSHCMATFIYISIFAKYMLYFWHADTSLQAVSGALGLVNTGLGDMEIYVCRRETGMSQKLLDIEYVGSCF